MRAYIYSALCLSIISCSSTVQVQVRKAPVVDLPGVKTISVESFNTSGSLDLDLMDRQGGLAGALLGVAVDVGANAALANQKQNQSFDKYFVSGLTQQFLQNGTFAILQNGGDAKLNGNIHYRVHDQRGTKEYTRKDGSKYMLSTLDRNAVVDVQVQVLDSRGQILGVNTLSASTHSSAESENLDRARGALAPWDGMVREALNRTWAGAVRTIAPYTVYETRTLAKGDSKGISKGNDAAEDGDWTFAEKYWREALNGSSKDQAAAWHNLAIRAEVQGQLEESLNLLLKARQLSDQSDWFQEENHLRARIAEEKRLNPKVETVPVETKDPKLPAPQVQDGPKSINQVLSR